MKICICDDQKADLEAIFDVLNSILKEKRIVAEIKCTQNPVDIFEVRYDLLLLDIEMPDMTGIEVKEKLFGKDRPLILFITNNDSVMQSAFGSQVIGFLKKPVSYETLMAYITNAVKLISINKEIYLTSKQTVISDDIKMFITDDGYIRAVFNDNSKSELLNQSLNYYEKELEDVYFLRVSSSYLINCRYIEYIDDDVVTVKGEKIKISRRKKKYCKDCFFEYKKKTRVIM